MRMRCVRLHMTAPSPVPPPGAVLAAAITKYRVEGVPSRAGVEKIGASGLGKALDGGKVGVGLLSVCNVKQVLS